MFIQRLITSLILIPLVLLILFFAPPWFLGGLVLLTLLAAGRECWQLIPLKSLAFQVGFLLFIVFGLWACDQLFSCWLILGLVLWVFICIAILTFPGSQYYWGYPLVVSSLCFLLLPLFLQCLIHIYYLPQGKSLILYLLFLIWASDVGAYITGKQLGKHKLIPQVSPGKSWEGVLGGIILAMIVAIFGFIHFKPMAFMYWLGLALCTVILSIFGDLFISILKRRSHIKDTGTLIPGHGGVLDRLDSLIAALPIFYFGLTHIQLGL
jgi:phosphatidate cytidylyltransferase